MVVMHRFLHLEPLVEVVEAVAHNSLDLVDQAVVGVANNP
jgi:hypothetical protein